MQRVNDSCRVFRVLRGAIVGSYLGDYTAICYRIVVRARMERLEVGCTYYRLTFADRDLTMPGVEPLVYLGDADPEGDEVPHIFQDTVSYSRFGSRLEMPQDREEVLVYFVSPKEVGSGILDVQQVASAIAAAAERAAALHNPKLPVLRGGWASVP